MALVLLIAMLSIGILQAFPTGSFGNVFQEYVLRKDGELLCLEDFGLKGRVRKMYVETSGSANEHIQTNVNELYRFHENGFLHTTISYRPYQLPSGMRFHYDDQNRIQRLESYIYEDGLFDNSPDQDDIYPDNFDLLVYQYGADGRVKSIETDSGSTDGFNYENNGFTIESRYEGIVTQTRTYDNSGRPLTDIYSPDASIWLQHNRYEYDDVNRTRTLFKGTGLNDIQEKEVCTYDAEGRLIRLEQYSSNVLQSSETREYNANGLLYRQRITRPGQPVESYTYVYRFDQVGNITEIRGGADLVTIRYEYYR